MRNQCRWEMENNFLFATVHSKSAEFNNVAPCAGYHCVKNVGMNSNQSNALNVLTVDDLELCLYVCKNKIIAETRKYMTCSVLFE